MRKTQAKPDIAQAPEEKNVVHAGTGYIETPQCWDMQPAFIQK